MLLGAGDPALAMLRRRDTLGAALLLLALSLAYYVGVYIGFAFTLAENAVSLLWPPNAILLAALLVCPPRVWGWLLLAVLPAHLIAELAAGVPLSMAMSWYTSNVSEALLGAAIVRGVLGDAPRFDRVRDVSVYLLAAVAISPVITSFLDAGLVALIGWRYDGDYWGVFRTRLFSNALAAVIVPPVIVIILRSQLSLLHKAHRALQIEAAALFIVLCAVSFLAFHEPRSAGEAEPPPVQG